jgi:hypothetical protein
MKPGVKALLDSIQPSVLADQCLHPENWTRDGHRISGVEWGASINDGAYLTVWVMEPAGVNRLGQVSDTPALVGYPSNGNGEAMIAMDVMGQYQLRHEDKRALYGRCPQCGSAHTSEIFTSGFITPLIPGTGPSMRSRGRGTICSDCGFGVHEEKVRTVYPGKT